MKTAKTRSDGVDRFTGNGKGITHVSKNTAAQQKAVDEYNAAHGKTAKTGKKG